MRRSLLKLMVFIGSILVFSCTAKLFQYYHKPEPEFYKSIKGDKNCFFVGSSRIALGVNTRLLKEHIQDVDFYNLGVYRQAFNYSIPIANKLMKLKGKKLIYVELTRIKLLNVVNNYSFLNYTEHIKADMTHFKTLPHVSINTLNIFLKTFEEYALNTISVKTNLAALSYNNPIQSNTDIQKTDVTYTGTTAFFLKHEELERTQDDAKNISPYLDLINKTIQQANSTGSKIVFTLPVTFKDENERKILLSVYSHIPGEYKMTYTREFIDNITDVNNLNFPYHFNYRGASIYTTALLADIKKRL